MAEHIRLSILPLLPLLLVGCGSDASPTNGGGDDADVELATVVSGLSQPVDLTAPAGDPRLFVVEQAGRVRVVEDGALRPTPFLDLTDRVLSGGERGLLGLAFHPEFDANGRFFVYYTDTGGDSRIERFTAAAGADVVDASGGTLVLAVEQPFSNHNGGMLEFGPDGMLYVALGDGGSGGDPQGHGQDVGTLLGSILRLDVDGDGPYDIPPDNPFVGQAGARGEIWAYGLRNPWRFAFDSDEGLLYIADVGQNAWEEVDVQPADEGGLNYGWNLMEGSHCFPDDPCDPTGLVLPAIEYGHAEGCSVTGGRVYRGAAIPGLEGTYFYADYCEGWIRSFQFVAGDVTEAQEWAFGDIGSVTSFGEDAAGELYVLSAGGTVYRIEPR